MYRVFLSSRLRAKKYIRKYKLSLRHRKLNLPLIDYLVCFTGRTSEDGDFLNASSGFPLVICVNGIWYDVNTRINTRN